MACAYSKKKTVTRGQRDYSPYFGWGYWTNDGFAPDELRCNGCKYTKCSKRIKLTKQEIKEFNDRYNKRAG